METFNGLDYVILTILGLSALASFVKGFAREAISLAAWIVAIIVSIRFMAPVSALFVGVIQGEPLRWAAAFLSVFVAVLLAGALLKLVFGRFIQEAELGGVDRLLGLVFGLARGSMVVVVLLFLFRITSTTPLQGWEGSRLLPHFDRVSVWMVQFLPISKLLPKDSPLALQHSKPLPDRPTQTLAKETPLPYKNVSDKDKLDLLIGSLLEKEGQTDTPNNPKGD